MIILIKILYLYIRVCIFVLNKSQNRASDKQKYLGKIKSAVLRQNLILDYSILSSPSRNQHYLKKNCTL